MPSLVDHLAVLAIVADLHSKMGLGGRHLFAEPICRFAGNDPAGHVADQFFQVGNDRSQRAVQHEAQRPQGMIGRAEIAEVDIRGRETPQRPEPPRGTIDHRLA